MTTDNAMLEKWVDSDANGTPFSVLARLPENERAFVAMVRIEGGKDYVEPLGEARFDDLDSAIEAGIAFACGVAKNGDAPQDQ